MVGPRDTPDCGLMKLRIHDGSATDEEKYQIVSHLYQPENFIFPASQEGKQMRSFQSSWFLKYPWLTYSRTENGGYCAYCFVGMMEVELWQTVFMVQAVSSFKDIHLPSSFTVAVMF